MKLGDAVVLSMLMAVPHAQAQYTAQKDAMYMVTLKAVVNYKIDDEENLINIGRLRENERFNRDLVKMLGKLSNKRTKNALNSRVYKILLQAGKDIYNELD